MASPEFLSENEVTISNLVQLFKRAFIKTSFDEDGDLIANIDDVRVTVIVNTDGKYIRSYMCYRFEEGNNQAAKHALINKMNLEWNLARFSISADANVEVLVVDYFISFEEGVLAYQIVSSARSLTRIALNAISACDTDGLVR